MKPSLPFENDAALQDHPTHVGRGRRLRVFAWMVRITLTHVGRGRIFKLSLCATRDHPHARGERPPLQAEPGRQSGSPPRTWGEALIWGMRALTRGITPTHVGRGSWPCRRRPASQDHPHARGERVEMTASAMATAGSPPRTWGEAHGRDPRIGGGGITPTHVGRGSNSWRVGGVVTDHPHARGERGMSSGSESTCPGSPPRTWGEGSLPREERRAGGITPTHVGRGSSGASIAASSSDHPHARGERQIVNACEIASPGSPPRTWGEVPVGRLRRSRRGITPTHVGRGRQRLCKTPTPADHPHARGERRPRSARASARRGSPPRTWGEGGSATEFSRGLGITPTHVGRGARPRCWRRGLADHPHARGERGGAEYEAGEEEGSPPRTWGEGLHLHRVQPFLRITPTHVGRGRRGARPLR